MNEPTLTEFLLARLAEDESDAHALDKELQRWHREREANGPDGSQGSILASLLTPESALHPARVLAECQAKRRIAEESWHTMGPSTAEEWLLPLLALPYADHPDYREEWKP